VSAKVYVGNLPFSFTDKELAEAFSSFGEITEAVVISNKYSGRSKGFGFVTFASKESADKAISEMNGKEVAGRALKVSEAVPMESSERGPPRRDFGDRRPRQSESSDENSEE